SQSAGHAGAAAPLPLSANGETSRTRIALEPAATASVSLDLCNDGTPDAAAGVYSPYTRVYNIPAIKNTSSSLTDPNNTTSRASSPHLPAYNPVSHLDVGDHKPKFMRPKLTRSSTLPSPETEHPPIQRSSSLDQESDDLWLHPNDRKAHYFSTTNLHIRDLFSQTIEHHSDSDDSFSHSDSDSSEEVIIDGSNRKRRITQILAPIIHRNSKLIEIVSEGAMRIQDSRQKIPKDTSQDVVLMIDGNEDMSSPKSDIDSKTDKILSESKSYLKENNIKEVMSENQVEYSEVSIDIGDNQLSESNVSNHVAHNARRSSNPEIPNTSNPLFKSMSVGNEMGSVLNNLSDHQNKENQLVPALRKRSISKNSKDRVSWQADDEIPSEDNSNSKYDLERQSSMPTMPVFLDSEKGNESPSFLRKILNSRFMKLGRTDSIRSNISNPFQNKDEGLFRSNSENYNYRRRQKLHNSPERRRGIVRSRSDDH
ncbi:unnamed protein product, partial [Meganyctiphanes norvegica]